MKLFKPTKKIAIITGVIVLSVIGGVSAEVTNNNSPKTTALPEDTTQSEPATPVQEPTSTSTDTVTTTPVAAQSETITTTPPAAAVIPSFVTVKSYREIVIDENTSDCEYTYSDGTTYQWHWKTPQTVTITNSKGQTTGIAIHTVGLCDDSVIGIDKNSHPERP